MGKESRITSTSDRLVPDGGHSLSVDRFTRSAEHRRSSSAQCPYMAVFRRLNTLRISRQKKTIPTQQRDLPCVRHKGQAPGRKSPRPRAHRPARVEEDDAWSKCGGRPPGPRAARYQNGTSSSDGSGIAGMGRQTA
jgi:hypothetical protein